MIKKNDQELLRLPRLTGTVDQCDQAEKIRARFTRKAREVYQDDDKFDLIMKLFSYEAHALFWVGAKEYALEGVIGRIVRNNPSIQKLIELYS